MGFFEVSADIVAVLFGCGFVFGIVALVWLWAMVGFRESQLARSKAKFYDAKAALEVSKADQTKEGN